MGVSTIRLKRLERQIKLYFSAVKILAQRPTHISAVLLIIKTFIVKRETDRDRRTKRDRDG